MITEQQLARIEQLIQPITQIASWLLTKIGKLLVIALSALAVVWWLIVHEWAWSFWYLIPIALSLLPVVILAIWYLMLLDLVELPEVLDEFKQGFVKPTEPKLALEKTPVIERPREQTKKLPTLLKELWSLVQGIDAIRTVLTHTLFIANPISLLLLLCAIGLTCVYGIGAVLTLIVLAL
ncbi:hypothetical protein [Agitococcus lubricus]|uniref:Uncharacterized protein n=1 Tax=Agitococcus lubricus TaxID=1077255 RepID=A0A2T5IZX0_9GAMM|nr:hypothetical protein [Agitococcus lubricus]PTQ89607.1 hypothetical protein C8N29_106138 [Agitococcus lubricus]